MTLQAHYNLATRALDPLVGVLAAEFSATPATVALLSTCFALPYALANTLFGGTAEYAALWMKQAAMESGFYWYVTGMIAVSLIVYLRMPDTRTTSRI